MDRLQFLFGPDADRIVEGVDLGRESERRAFLAEHLGDPNDSRTDLRVPVRMVIAEQILDDDPPEAWATIRRLLDGGLGREEAMSQLSMIVAEQLSLAVASSSSFDMADYVASLDELPLPSRGEIARAAIDLVRERQGIGADEHAAALLEAFSPRASSVVERLLDRVIEQLVDGPLRWLPGDVTVHVPDLVDGRTFTHRFNEFEAELGSLNVGFDLGAFARFDTVRLEGGDEIEQFSVEHHHLGWRGPDGWLAGFEPGDLLAVTATVTAPAGDADGPVDAVVRIAVAANEPELTTEAVAAVRAAYDANVEGAGLPVPGDDLALWLCFHRPELLAAPLPPLRDLCEAAGLELRGSLVAHDEAVWRNDVFRTRYDRATAMVPESHWRLVLGRALDVLDDPDASVERVRAVLDECAEPETLDPLADVLFPHHLDESDEFELGTADAPGRLWELVGRAVSVARRPRETATAEYLAAVLHERCGAPDRAEEHLLRAAAAQPRLGPVVERMGWYRFDRGDARGAMRWWRELGELPESAHTIEPFLTPAGRKLGRNEPCWCGSGRKFKQCHQNATDLPPLPDRVGWLCRKASLWIDHCTGDQRSLVVDMAVARATGEADPGPWWYEDVGRDVAGDLLADALADPIVFDAALHEGGLFGSFLRDRGGLLPDDERLLAAAWVAVDRSVHEVVTVERGVGMSMRDLATGEVVEVRERTLSRDAAVGDRYCARVVPDGATHQIIGGVFPVRAGQEAAVLDLCDAGDGFELCAWAGSIARPPRLVHAPGMAEEMFDREAIEAVLAGVGPGADDADVSALLRAELSRQAQQRWLDEHVPALGGLTPREAAADPTRREQLERLLAEFERHDERLAGELGSGFQLAVYDVAELRRELGMPPGSAP